MHLQPGQSESEYYRLRISGLAAPLTAMLVKFASMTANLRLRKRIPMYVHVINHLESTNILKKIRDFAELVPFFDFHYHWVVQRTCDILR